jgi:magnesium transporter
MIRSLHFLKNRPLRTNLDLSEYSRILEAQEGLLWVDFQESPPEDDEPILQGIFHFHPLAVDDALQESHVPKVDDWGEYLYIVMHAISFDRLNTRIETLELDVFLGKNYIVTHHDRPIPAVDTLWDICQKDDDRFLKNGPDFFLYRLADEIVTSYMPVVEGVDEAVDLAEERVFARAGDVLPHIFALKRAILYLRRILGPQREVLNKLARDEFTVIDEQARVYFRDVYDHMVRMYDISDTLRDLITGTLDIYLSAVNNRMNEVMKTLTIVTSLFMPISFIASFFGMNFFATTDPREAWMGQVSFLITLLLMVAVPLIMLGIMSLRGWMRKA